MNNRKIPNCRMQLEDQIIKLVNKNQIYNRLNYSNVKEQIKINVREANLVKNNFINKIFIKLSLTFSLTIICLTLIILTISNQNLDKKLFTNIEMSYAIVNDKSLDGNTATPIDNSLLYNFIYLYIYENKTSVENKPLLPLEIEIPKLNQGAYYCAYLSKNTIQTIQNFYQENLEEHKASYLDFYENHKYKGIDDLFIKYLYYLSIQNDTLDQALKEIKWLKYDQSSKIKANIHNYQLIMVTTYRTINQGKSLEDDTPIVLDLTTITEVEAKFVNNQVTLMPDDGQSLVGSSYFMTDYGLINKDGGYITDNELSDYVFQLQMIDNHLVIAAKINDDVINHLNSEHSDQSDCNHPKYQKVIKAMNLLQKYMIKEEFCNYTVDRYIKVIYYDYENLKELFYN